MKKIIIVLLLASMSLMATEGARIYKQHCLICHGVSAEKTPGASKPLAGRDAGILAREIKAYRDQSDGVGCYTKDKSSMIMQESTYAITNEHIRVLAKYISSIK